MLEYAYDEDAGIASLIDVEAKFEINEDCDEFDSCLEDLWDMVAGQDLEVVIWASGLDTYSQDAKVLNYLVAVRGYRFQHIQRSEDGTMVYFLVHKNSLMS